MNVIFLCVCGYDRGVNALSPCHVEAGGLIGQFNHKKKPFLDPDRCLQQTEFNLCSFTAIVETHDTASLIPAVGTCSETALNLIYVFEKKKKKTIISCSLQTQWR